jgi:hypothetical protein
MVKSSLFVIRKELDEWTSELRFLSLLCELKELLRSEIVSETKGTMRTVWFISDTALMVGVAVAAASEG